MLATLNYGIDLGQGVILGAVELFNEKLLAEVADTFNFDIASVLPLGIKGRSEFDGKMPLNFTMTKAPEISSANDAWNMQIDGRFANGDMAKYVPSDAIYADPTKISNSTLQIYIHQSMINTLMYGMELPLSGDGAMNELFVLMPEIKRHYGANTTCEAVLTFPYEGDA